MGSRRREEAIVKATEGLDAKEQNGAFLVLSENEYARINRTEQPTTIEEFHGPSYPRSGKAETGDASRMLGRLEGLREVLTRAFRAVSSP